MTTRLNGSSYYYQQVEKALTFIDEHFRENPTLEEIARHVYLSKFHFERVFTRWAGTTPDRFLRYVSKEYTKGLLEESRSLLDVTFSSGLSSSSRLHDLYVSYEAMTPDEYRQKGTGLTVRHGVHLTPFGKCLVAVTKRGILEMQFVENGADVLNDLKREFPHATFVRDQSGTAGVVARLFSFAGQRTRKPFHLLLRGTNFQIKVWEALLRVPSGHVVSYDDVAALIGEARSQRAVGNALGANHLAYFIPCHRVIKRIGTTGHYRWGIFRKQAILGWEASMRNG